MCVCVSKWWGVSLFGRLMNMLSSAVDIGVSVGGDESKCWFADIHNNHAAHCTVPQRHRTAQLCPVSGNTHTQLDWWDWMFRGDLKYLFSLWMYRWFFWPHFFTCWAPVVNIINLWNGWSASHPSPNLDLLQMLSASLWKKPSGTRVHVELWICLKAVLLSPQYNIDWRLRTPNMYVCV